MLQYQSSEEVSATGGVSDDTSNLVPLDFVSLSTEAQRETVPLIEDFCALKRDKLH